MTATAMVLSCFVSHNAYYVLSPLPLAYYARNMHRFYNATVVTKKLFAYYMYSESSSRSALANCIAPLSVAEVSVHYTQYLQLSN